MNYMKLKVMPNGKGEIDGFFAMYKLAAKADTEKTSVPIEQSFKRYVELDAHREWKHKVREFLPDVEENISGQAKKEL